MNQDSDVSMGWWYVRYRMKWPEDQEPSWHIDLFLAHRLIAPVIYRFSSEITLWRFHRRAARDDEGHQFSFTFYSSPALADQIFKELKSASLIAKMKRAGLLIQDIYDNTDRTTAPHIADTSDGNWNPTIRKSWPFYIMGVCRMWLALIEEIAGDNPDQKKSSALRVMITRYLKVDDTIKTLWREQGCHSLLHHLNAIFGYEPVIIREAHLRRF